MPERPIVIATRGSALALVQANFVQAQCRQAFPSRQFELKVMKTTGDKLQTVSLAQPATSLPKGLFTKELEVALLDGSADLAVHSLKDLPTELPAGLILGATPKRADVRDVLIYREAPGFPAHLRPQAIVAGSVIATSSPRRKTQLLALNPGLKVVEVRGNVPTRLLKLAERKEFDGMILAAAGLARLGYTILPEGRLQGEGVPAGLFAVPFSVEEMLPCVGQAAIGIEIRANDPEVQTLVDKLNHAETLQCVTAERAFLRAMGGGCQSPVGAFAEISADQLQLRAVSFTGSAPRRCSKSGSALQAEVLGQAVAAELR